MLNELMQNNLHQPCSPEIPVEDCLLGSSNGLSDICGRIEFALSDRIRQRRFGPVLSFAVRAARRGSSVFCGQWETVRYTVSRQSLGHADGSRFHDCRARSRNSGLCLSDKAHILSVSSMRSVETAVRQVILLAWRRLGTVRIDRLPKRN